MRFKFKRISVFKSPSIDFSIFTRFSRNEAKLHFNFPHSIFTRALFLSAMQWRGEQWGKSQNNMKMEIWGDGNLGKFNFKVHTSRQMKFLNSSLRILIQFLVFFLVCKSQIEYSLCYTFSLNTHCEVVYEKEKETSQINRHHVDTWCFSFS